MTRNLREWSPIENGPIPTVAAISSHCIEYSFLFKQSFIDICPSGYSYLYSRMSQSKIEDLANSLRVVFVSDDRTSSGRSRSCLVHALTHTRLNNY